MFLSHRLNPFETFERTFDTLFDDDYSDFFSNMRIPQYKTITREEQLKRSLNHLHNQENEITHYIKQYESHIEQLKKKQEQIESQKTEITNKISKIVEEKKKQVENSSSQSANPSENSQNKSESRVFKKMHYITDDMEIEEQYDSTNPKNCYKVIRKQGEAPQVITGEQQNAQIESKKEEQAQQCQIEKLGEGLDDKFEQLCRLVGKRNNNIRNLIIENKELTIGQLYDKAAELKLI